MKMNLYGYASGLLGYNIHTRGFASGCIENGIDVKLIPYGDQLDENITKSRTIMNALGKEFHYESPSVSISYPNDMFRFTGKKRIGYTLWESTKLPSKWVKIINSVDEVWTCSQFCKDIFLKNGITKDIHVVKEGVDTTLFHKYVKPFEKPDPKGFYFCSVFRWEPRKSPDILLKAFTEEFSNDEHAHLILECFNPAMPNANYWQEMIRLKLKTDNLNNVALLSDRQVPQEQLARFYRTCDCFVLPTKSEAWGLPTLEALASGIPAITTNWGGSLEFMNNDVGWLIDVEKMEMPLSPYLGFDKPIEGNEWAVPSLKHLKELMRYAFEHPEECKKKGEKAYDWADNNFTWAKSTEIVKELLKE